ncbi:MAG TPA: pyrroloquinoline quinone biosynthesis protein PqqB [Bosea sp. (in: a-proteobacteria)]|jgi:pyrroloquinoline quinone biosynthesis protein B|uniref:pyrroloquinoline quinone biosynthesis protein PqqB n=1 Tax=Bosea sp. (in: a-proteobacteria) TaxID=1871050 RepID=UPI002E0EEC02|nr:pyrroloquinoline quinone biosynthesis protein PqqB [Bosea sp. (in: a-proteobacteria)]
MKGLVLGTAAGGGSPQWNCRCRVCALAWSKDPRVPWRTQTSLAVTLDGESWVVLNASPDLGSQIRATPALWPREQRHSPIGTIILSSAEIDHVAGLLHLRERQPFDLIALEPVLDAIDANPIFAPVPARRVAATALGAIEMRGGLTAELFPVPGKVPLYLEDGAPQLESEAGETAGIRVSGGGRSIVYIPGCAALSAEVRARADAADILFFDGTLFTDDEMIRAGVGEKTGRRMGHMPISGAGGSLEWLEGVLAARKIYIHLNNTNPALIEGSPERLIIEAAGVEVAFDGMEVRL